MLRDDIHISSCDRFLHKLYTNLLPKIQEQEDSISTIIQGPLNDRSLKSIPHYLKYGEVIVSCWANDDLSRIKGINSEVKIVINNTNQLPKLKKKQQEIVKDLKFQIQSLVGEREAIQNFNHTRFIQLKDQESEGEKQSKELIEVEGKIKDLQAKILKCSESDTKKEELFKDDLHFLEMEKESIENFTHDHFLENVESMKVKRRSGLR